MFAPEERITVLALARRRIEQLRDRGRLKRWAARWDLKTVEYLERHPERGFPEGARGWFREAGLSLWFSDPGAYRIFRVLVFGGAAPEPSRSRPLAACTAFIGAGFAVLEYVVLIGMELIHRIQTPRGLSLRHLGELANLALIFSGAGVVVAFLLYFVIRAEFRKMDGWIRELD